VSDRDSVQDVFDLIRRRYLNQPKQPLGVILPLSALHVTLMV
jgi:hypothetical protein